MKLEHKGRVRWFNKHFGYGFITHEDGQDVFAHYSCVCGEGRRVLEENEVVYYDVELTDKGLRATEVV